VETGVPAVKVSFSGTVLFSERSTPRIARGNSGVLGTGGDNVSNSVRRSVSGSGAPVISGLGLSDGSSGLGGDSSLGGGLGSSGLLGSSDLSGLGSSSLSRSNLLLSKS
jgi:hypothetical protein